MNKLSMMLAVMTLGTGISAYAHGPVDFSKFQPKDSENDIYLTIGSDALWSTKAMFKQNVEIMEVRDDIALIKTKASAAEYLSGLMHQEFHRCGGYIFHDNLDDARVDLYAQENRELASKAVFTDYTIDQQDVVSPLIKQVNDGNIEANIRKLSSFKNRYYQSDYGVESQAWLKQTWEGLSAGRSDVKVEYFEHRSWKQPSVIMTVTGSVHPDQVVVMGGHADSISGWFGGNNINAPGADDNASGISSITEMIRILMQNDYRPEKTIKFMAYSAEEVGLRGSKEIATEYKNDGANVIGVMQLDMTNFNGSADFDIVMMTDYTNQEQNEFVGRIIDEYLTGLRWGYDKCGYGCSDHASWHSEGYPATMPFEATFDTMNHKLHTPQDTIDISRGTASHASKFTKLGLAFIVELDR